MFIIRNSEKGSYFIELESEDGKCSGLPKNRKDCQEEEGSGKYNYLCAFDGMGSHCVVSLLLDDFDIPEKLWGVQFGVYSEVLHLIPDPAELCGCFYHGFTWKVSAQHNDFCSDNNRDYVVCDYPCGVCVCKA